MRDSGYVYNYQKGSAAGRLLVCSGAFVGLRVGFFVEECGEALRQALAALPGDILLPQQNPAPAGAIRVSFGYRVWADGANTWVIATDVDLA